MGRRRGNVEGPGGARFHRGCLAVYQAEQARTAERAKQHRAKREPPARLPVLPGRRVLEKR